MTSRSLLDPELAPIIEFIELMPPFTFSAETLPQIRQGFEEQVKRETVADPHVLRREQQVPGPQGAPPLRVVIHAPAAPAPAGSRRPALLHVHGGGYVMGRPEINDPRNASLVTALDCVVVSVGYRLAPETVFPGAVEDCYAALLWLRDNAGELSVDPDRIGLIGESAGGGLAACLALLAHDRGEVKPCFQMLIYPMLDDRTGSSHAPSPFAGEFGWTAASNRFGWSSLLGHPPGGDDVSPHAAAARAPSLAGLPPCFIAVGAMDLFADEDIDYARRLITAGVPTELHVYPGAVHGFDVVQEAHVSRQFTRDVESALRRGLSPGSPPS